MSKAAELHLRTTSLLSRQITFLAHLHRQQQQCRWASSVASETINRPLVSSKPVPIPLKHHIPQPLSRPIGQSTPPEPGQNTGIDTRTWRQRRDDFFDYDKHLARRRQLTQAVAKPYFREWTSIDPQHKGKTFLSPRTLFKADRALYFPNLRGYTLADCWKVDQDTTNALAGKLSLIVVYSGQWAQSQTDSFVSKATNPDLELLLRKNSGMIQKIEINVEKTRGRAALVWVFVRRLRKSRVTEDWGKYFVVRRGLTDHVKMDMGFVNEKVGYVYLVDRDCKIRWAGSGEAGGGEREGLVASVRRLIDPFKKEQLRTR